MPLHPFTSSPHAQRHHLRGPRLLAGGAAILGALLLSAPAAADVAFEAEDAQLRREARVFSDTAASGERAVAIPAGSVRRHLATSERGRKVEVTARGDSCAGNPWMAIRLDRKLVERVEVTSQQWSAYSATVGVPPGKHLVGVRLYNPDDTSSCDRTLNVDKVSVAGDDSDPGGGGAPAGSGASFHRLAYGSSPKFANIARAANQNRFIVLQSWELSKLRALKQANPDVQVLMYKNLGMMKKSTGVLADDGRRYQASGVTYDEAQRDNPSWILKDRSGDPIPGGNGAWWNWAADIGIDSYQDRWARNVISDLEAQPQWDGVFLDDVNSTIRFHHDMYDIAGYRPDDANPETNDDYELAMRDALANVGPKLRAAGATTVANVCCELQNESWAESLPYLSGALDEMFVKWGDHNTSLSTYRWGDAWKTHLDMVVEAERQNKFFLGATHSTKTDARAMRYGLATMMLGTQGRASFMHAAQYTEEIWFPDYDLALELGRPTMDSYSRYSTGPADDVYFRRYEHGIVLVNAARPGVASSQRRVDLGASYSGSGYRGVKSVTMPGVSGLVLKKDG